MIHTFAFLRVWAYFIFFHLTRFKCLYYMAKNSIIWCHRHNDASPHAVDNATVCIIRWHQYNAANIRHYTVNCCR